MSTSIQEVTPLSASYYLPPEWLLREIKTRSWPRRTRGSFPHSGLSARSGGLAARNYSVNTGNQVRNPKHGNKRIELFAFGLAAVAWTSFLITAIVRLDPSNFGQWRDRLIFAEVSKPPLAEQLEAATNAIREVSRRILMSTLIGTDSTGTTDKALPLLMKATSLAPNTEIILTGLASGTTLTSGASLGAGEWRINIADLPSAHVVPPHGYSGLMTLVAELRDSDGNPLSSTPVHLKWTAAEETSSHDDNNEAAAEQAPINTLASAEDPQDHQLSVQSVDQKIETVVLPKPRPIKHASFAPKAGKPKKQMAMTQKHKYRAARRDRNIGADSRWASGQLPAYSLVADPRAERQATLDWIFRDFFDSGRYANNCAAANYSGQKQSRDDCAGSR